MFNRATINMNTTMFKVVVCNGIIAGRPDLDSTIFIIRAVVILDEIAAGIEEEDCVTIVQADVVCNCVVAAGTPELNSIIVRVASIVYKDIAAWIEEANSMAIKQTVIAFDNIVIISPD